MLVYILLALIVLGIATAGWWVDHKNVYVSILGAGVTFVSCGAAIVLGVVSVGVQYSHIERVEQEWSLEAKQGVYLLEGTHTHYVFAESGETLTLPRDVTIVAGEPHLSVVKWWGQPDFLHPWAAPVKTEYTLSLPRG